jgi:homocysteine S-methyltransferase
LDTHGVVVIDGAMATELERHGFDLRDALWSAKVLIESPETIKRVHTDYFEAGADVAISASYQATFEGFARIGIDRRETRDLLRLSVRLAQEARDAFWDRLADSPTAKPRARPLVAASIGCYGAFLHDGSEYRGNYGLSINQLLDFHRERLEVLIESGPDLLACETLPCLAEAEALVELLEEFPDVPAWLSFSCKDNREVAEGQTLARCIDLAEQSERVIAVGINCTAPQHVSELLRSIAGRTLKPLIVYPNSGERWDAAAHAWRPTENTVDIPTAAPGWYELGARILGGCCRTTPETIDRLSESLHNHIDRRQRGTDGPTSMNDT